MSLIFLERKGKIIPMMVTTGDFLLSDRAYEPWSCDKYELSKLSVGDLKRLLLEGYVTFPKKANRDQLIELVWEHYDDIFNQMSVKCQLSRRREGPKYKHTAVMTEPPSEAEEEEAEDDEEAEEEEAEDDYDEEAEEEEAEDDEEAEEEEAEEEEAEDDEEAEEEEAEDDEEAEEKEAEEEEVEDDKEAVELQESDADSVLSHASADSPLRLPKNYLNDPTEFLPKGVFSVFVQVKDDKHRCMPFIVSYTDTIADLKKMAKKDYGIDLNEFRVDFRRDLFFIKIIDENKRIGDIVDQEYKTFYITPNLAGGALTRYLKKDEAVKHLKTKSTKGIVKTEVPVNVDLPQKFKEFTDIYTNMMAEIRLMKSQGINAIQVGLRRVTDDQLKTIKEIMSYDKRRGTTTERLLKVIEFIFPTMCELETAGLSIVRLKEEITQEFVHLYIDFYHQFKDGEAQCANSQFCDDIRFEEGRRKGTQSSQTAQSPEGEHEPSNCVVA